MDFLKKLPSVQEVLLKYPLNKEYVKRKKERDDEIKNVLRGMSNKFILIVGPCSADREDSVLDYVKRLADLQKKVQSSILIMPRIYTSKPRTIGNGYKGMLHQPFLDRGEDIAEGILSVRRLHKRVIDETGLSGADEMLYPEMIRYVSDLLSYVTIGARSVENQQHRLTSSGLELPVGMKNPVSGDISVMLNSIATAQYPHHFIYNSWEVISQGNAYAHVILRGYINSSKEVVSNYSYEDLLSILKLYKARNLENISLIIDCNHNNSNKDYLKQIDIAYDVLQSMQKNSELSMAIKGLMIESYIEDGCQPISSKIYGKSITDPCLGWEKTEKLIIEIAERIQKINK